MTYDAATKINIFDGPTMALDPDGAGGVIQYFPPWHRDWRTASSWADFKLHSARSLGTGACSLRDFM
ncbi:MAG: hypothetical protein EPN23_10735 [Verrucomicrobia bacterium]|nr:MAG: hypothetical protein EPN23_10735 [Verrucomicrobiota bacterium]